MEIKIACRYPSLKLLGVIMIRKTRKTSEYKAADSTTISSTFLSGQVSGWKPISRATVTIRKTMRAVEIAVPAKERQKKTMPDFANDSGLNTPTGVRILGII
jgi:hypothetical protein